MAFADPYVVTVGAASPSMAAVSRGDNQTSYRSADGLVSAKVSHQYGKRNRSVIRIDFSKIAADPFAPSVNQKFTHSAYLVYERPPVGFTATEQQDLIKALLNKSIATTFADVTKLVAGEN
jgi:hypothetical protein